MDDNATSRQTSNLNCFNVVAGRRSWKLIRAKGDTRLVESIRLVSSESIRNNFKVDHGTWLDGQDELDRPNLIPQIAILEELIERWLDDDRIFAKVVGIIRLGQLQCPKHFTVINNTTRRQALDFDCLLVAAGRF